jgi:hypothetical protein
MPCRRPGTLRGVGPARVPARERACSAPRSAHRNTCIAGPSHPSHPPAIRESTRKTLRDRRRALPASGVKIRSAERASCGKRGDALAAPGAVPGMRRARSPAIGVACGLIVHFWPAHRRSLLASEPWPGRQRRTRPGSISATTPGRQTAAITNAGPVPRGQSKLRGEMALKYTPTTIAPAIKQRVRRYADASYPQPRVSAPAGPVYQLPPADRGSAGIRTPLHTQLRDSLSGGRRPALGEDRDSVAVSEALGGAVVGTLPTSASTREHKRGSYPGRIESGSDRRAWPWQAARPRRSRRGACLWAKTIARRSERRRLLSVGRRRQRRRGKHACGVARPLTIPSAQLRAHRSAPARPVIGWAPTLDPLALLSGIAARRSLALSRGLNSAAGSRIRPRASAGGRVRDHAFAQANCAGQSR